MAGLIIRVPDSFNNPNLPVLRGDPILPETGALLLVDMNHPESESIALETDTLMTNIAAEQAGALLGVTEAETSANLWVFAVDNPATAYGLVEFSEKGGIHCVYRGGVTVGNGIKIRFPDAVKAHLADNPSNDYFVSLWMYLTEANNGTGAYSAVSLGSSTGTNSVHYSLTNAMNQYPLLAENRLGARQEPSSTKLDDGATPGPVIRNIGIADHTGAVAAEPNVDRNTKVFGIGHQYPFEGLTGQGIFYRYYMEDLTISGRTYEEVDQIDYALYTREVLTPGGRYYGDTYTDPATIT